MKEESAKIEAPKDAENKADFFDDFDAAFGGDYGQEADVPAPKKEEKPAKQTMAAPMPLAATEETRAPVKPEVVMVSQVAAKLTNQGLDATKMTAETSHVSSEPQRAAENLYASTKLGPQFDCVEDAPKLPTT